jgi:hypothetical protein
MKKNLITSFLFALTACSKLHTQTWINDIAFVSLSNSLSKNLFSKEEGSITALSFTHLETYFKKKIKTKVVLGYTKQDRPVNVYYFPGTSNKRALVIGGMHGSELSSIEVARNIIKALSNGAVPYYDVLIIPNLFPDNSVSAASAQGKDKETNFGRYSSRASADPNRQMPCLGKQFNADNPVDFTGRIIEKENQYLLQLIQDFKPERIVNLHAIKDVKKAGIYADPRTDCNSVALGFDEDSTLAVTMAKHISNKGGWVPGNSLAINPTALYYNDPEIASAGSLQKRNLHGSSLPNNRGFGVSLGGWATSAVCSEKDAMIRDAIQLITVEFPGYKPSSAYSEKAQKDSCTLNIQLYSSAVSSVFLSSIGQN